MEDRTINESLDFLDACRVEIKDALFRKNIELEDIPKIGEVAGHINKITAKSLEEANIYGGEIFLSQVKKWGIDPTKISFVKDEKPTDGYIDISLNKDDSVKMWCNGTEIKVSSEKKVSPKSCYKMFYGLTSLTEIVFDNFVTSSAVNMSYMFYNCFNLKNLDLKNFDTANVIDMSYMFQTCSKLESLSLDSFITSYVCNMSYMFQNCTNLSEVTLSYFETENVLDMSYMFSGCSELRDLDLDSFKTSNVTNMMYMFNGCTNLQNLSVRNFEDSYNR